jgi:hypothetical protein
MAKAFPNTGVTIIDSSSDLPAASAALEGVLMFQKDSNELKICDGANWRSVIDTDRPPGIELIQPTSVDGGTNNNGAVTYSSVSGVRLNGVFSSVHDNYRVIVDNTAGTAGAYLQMRFSTNGADYTASNYYLGGGYSGITGTQGFYGGAATSLVSLQQVWGDRTKLSIDFYKPFSTGTHVWTGQGFGDNNSWQYGNYFSGSELGFTARDGFIFFPNTGTISGTIRVYGYRNSV